jgi:hypothetical protein
MYWECQYYVLAEDGALLGRDFLTLARVLESRAVCKGTQEESEVQQASIQRSWPNAWLQTVEEYTKRVLTNDQDKLPALAGVAHLVARQTGDMYFAGLWRADIIQCLNWSIEVFQPRHYCDDPAHDAAMPPATKSSVRYPSEYRAPSWSWAALDGKIIYSPLNTSKIQAKCLDVQVYPKRRDKFGELKSAWILLQGSDFLRPPPFESVGLMVSGPVLRFKEGTSR